MKHFLILVSNARLTEAVHKSMLAKKIFPSELYEICICKKMSAKFDIYEQFYVMKCPIFHPKYLKFALFFGQNMSPLKRKKPTLMAVASPVPA